MRTKYFIEQRFAGDMAGIDDTFVAFGYDENIIKNMYKAFTAYQAEWDAEFGEYKNDCDLEAETAYRGRSYYLIRNDGKKKEYYNATTDSWDKW